MKPRPGEISWPSATPCLRVPSTVRGSSNMVLLMMAAPALEPAMTPPLRYMSHRASSTSELLPSGRRSERVMRDWSPPAK